MMTKMLLLIFIAIATAGAARAEDKTDAANSEAQIAREKARQFAVEKNWGKARSEAEKATQLDPTDADAWVILGTVEQRLDHQSAALAAYRKYLALAPKGDKASNVRQRIADLEVTAEKQDQQKTSEAKAAYGTEGKGLILGFSPVFKPAISEAPLSSSIANAFIFGLHWTQIFDGYIRYSSGNIPSLQASSDPANKGALKTFTDVHNSIIAGIAQFNIPLNAPYEKLGGFQFYIPIAIGGYSFFVDVPSDKHSNIAFEGGGGFGARFYTGSFVAFDATAQYHLSFPLYDLQDQYGNNIAEPDGTIIRGNSRGLEFRISATFFLF